MAELLHPKKVATQKVIPIETTIEFLLFMITGTNFIIFQNFTVTQKTECLQHDCEGQNVLKRKHYYLVGWNIESKGLDQMFIEMRISIIYPVNTLVLSPVLINKP